MATLVGGDLAVEAETPIRDIQMVDRRCALKRRDGRLDRMILLLADTSHHRALLDVYREDLRASFPLDGRALLPALRAGRRPEASGILVL